MNEVTVEDRSFIAHGKPIWKIGGNVRRYDGNDLFLYLIIDIYSQYCTAVKGRMKFQRVI